MSDDLLTCIAVDPGNEDSGYVLFSPDEKAVGGMRVLETGVLSNAALRKLLRQREYETLLVETPKARGMPTSNEEMETLIWVGRFFECAIRRGKLWSMIWRSDVKLFLCGATAKVSDANVSAALKDYFGGEERAIGGKQCQTCNGRGTVAGGRTACDVCDGTKQVEGARGPKKCPQCKGRGDVPVGRVSCRKCSGNGRLHPPGPLHGVATHAWAALGVAVAWLNKPTFTHRLLSEGSNELKAEARKAKKALRDAKAAAKAAKAK